MTDNQTTNNPARQAALAEIVTRIMYCLTTDDFGFGGNNREDRAVFDAHQTLTRWNNAALNEDTISKRDLSNSLTDAITRKIAIIRGIDTQSEVDLRSLYGDCQWLYYNHVAEAVRRVFDREK